MPDVSDQVSLANLAYWVVTALAIVGWTITRFTFGNYVKRVDGITAQFGDFLVRLARAEQCITAIDQTVQSNKATVAAVASAQQASALDVAKLEGLQELRKDVREMRTGVDNMAREFAELKGQLKRGSSGQHQARRS